MSRLKPNQSGDTIVEVLIAMAVAALVLASSYAIANHSSLTIQDTQEHSQALQYAQGQIELLRTYVQNNGNPAPGFFNGSQCLSQSLTVLSGASLSSCSGASDPAQYKVRLSGPDASNTYSADVSWDSLLGGVTNDVKLYYRP